jgi:amino acid permease
MRRSTIFLQIVVTLVGIGVLAFLIGEPQIEGRNAHATLFQIYFEDPFLAVAYPASLPIFVALWQAFQVLARIRRGQAFSAETVRALRIVKYCAAAIACFAVAAAAYLFLVQRSKDDIAGGVAMCLLLIATSATIAAAAEMFERVFQTPRS